MGKNDNEFSESGLNKNTIPLDKLFNEEENGKEEMQEKRENEGNGNAEEKDNGRSEEEKIKDKKIANYYYKQLVDNGTLKEGLEINSLEDLNKAIEKAKEEYLESFKEELPDDLKKKVEAYKQGIDYKKIEQHEQALDYYEKITEEDLKGNDQLALQLVENLLKQNGDDDNYIKERLDLIKDSDTYLIEGKRALKILKSRELALKEAKLKEEQNKQKQLEKMVEDFKKGVEDVLKDEKNLWGLKPTENEKRKLMLAMFNPKEFKDTYKDLKPFEEATKDPKVLARIYYLYIKGVFNDNGKFDFLEKRAKSKATEEIESLLLGGNKIGYANADEDKNQPSGLSFMETISQNLKPR